MTEKALVIWPQQLLSTVRATSHRGFPGEPENRDHPAIILLEVAACEFGENGLERHNTAHLLKDRANGSGRNGEVGRMTLMPISLAAEKT